MAKEKKPFNSIDYIFCSDDYLLGINKTYLGHDDLTDVITFDLSNPKEAIISEVYISVERVKENALLFKTTFVSELHRVMLHGALHLCGFKDKTSKQKKEIREKEDYYLKILKAVPRITVSK
jgi:probable rRNA maturation factor